MEQHAMELPSSIYYLVGMIVVSNLGVLITIIVAVLKGSFWLGKTLTKLDAKADKASDSAIRAHKRIDVVEKEIHR